MTSTAPDPEAISQAYARLSAKFKALWTFHQFLQGVHRTSLRGATGPAVSFAPLYEQIKRIKETKGVEPAADTRAAMARLDDQLDMLHATLAEKNISSLVLPISSCIFFIDARCSSLSFS